LAAVAELHVADTIDAPMDFHQKPQDQSRASQPPPVPGSSFLVRLQYELLRKNSRGWAGFGADLILGLGFCIVGAIASSVLLKILGIPTGGNNDWLLGEIREHFTFIVVLGVLLVPPIEEALFRLLPRVIGSYWLDPRAPQWSLGIAMTILFGFGHIDPSRLTVPLPQMVAGLVFWYMQWRHGFLGAVCMHALFNATIFIMLALSFG